MGVSFGVIKKVFPSLNHYFMCQLFSTEQKSNTPSVMSISTFTFILFYVFLPSYQYHLWKRSVHYMTHIGTSPTPFGTEAFVLDVAFQVQIRYFPVSWTNYTLIWQQHTQQYILLPPLAAEPIVSHDEGLLVCCLSNMK